MLVDPVMYSFIFILLILGDFGVRGVDETASYCELGPYVQRSYMWLVIDGLRTRLFLDLVYKLNVHFGRRRQRRTCAASHLAIVGLVEFSHPGLAIAVDSKEHEAVERDESHAKEQGVQAQATTLVWWGGRRWGARQEEEWRIWWKPLAVNTRTLPTSVLPVGRLRSVIVRVDTSIVRGIVPCPCTMAAVRLSSMVISRTALRVEPIQVRQHLVPQCWYSRRERLRRRVGWRRRSGRRWWPGCWRRRQWWRHGRLWRRPDDAIRQVAELMIGSLARHLRFRGGGGIIQKGPAQR